MGELIKVSQQFKSSARINQRDLDQSSFLRDFIAHGTIEKTLSNLISELEGTDQRAFTVTGPYGSGKSTLAIFLSALFDSDVTVSTEALGKLSLSLAEMVEAFRASRDRWVIVPCLCGLGSPMHAITDAIIRAGVKELSDVDSLSEESCLELLRTEFAEFSKKNVGVILLIDEFGKALDFQARNAGDLHFFQSFADIVQDAGNVFSINFLHQAFSAYAKNRDSQTQDEWSKVQGRYKDFAFNPSVEEAVYLVSQAFSVEAPLAEKLANKNAELTELISSEFLPSGSGVLASSLPLDPLVAVLLGPTFKKSFAQNERSLFSFIATNERNGFRDYVARQMKVSTPFDNLYCPRDLWAYLDENLGHVIASSSESKEWVEASDSIRRADQLFDDPAYGDLTRIIALTSVMGRASGIQFSKQVLMKYAALQPHIGLSEEKVEAILSELEAKSVIIFRHALNAYHVFQASDLDVNRLVFEWAERLKQGVDWTRAISTRETVLASRHYHRYGVLRWADTQVINSSEHFDALVKKPTDAFVTLVLPTSNEVHEQLTSGIDAYDSYALAKPPNTDALKAACVELLALQEAQRDEADTLSRDPIARSELETRVAAARLVLRDQLSACFESASWSFQGELVKGRSLSAKVSAIADIIYYRCPVVPNELINRNKLSGSANSALNKLLQAMLTNGDRPDLGFPLDTFPPEKGIFISCLQKKGWHTPDLESVFAGSWITSSTVAESDPNYDSYLVWKAGYDLITDAGKLVTVQELQEFWIAPPYGLTAGLSKLYSMALIKSLEDHLAFYDFDSTKEWIYIPDLDEELVNKFLRYPGEAAVKFYQLGGVQDQLIEQVASAASGEHAVDSVSSPLSAAKALVKLVYSLPSWVKRTSGENLFQVSGPAHLSAEVKRFRDVVLSAKDPFRLILDDLPKVFDEDDELDLKLRLSLETLNELDVNVADRFKDTLLELLNAELNSELSNRCRRVVQHASRPEIENFAERLYELNEDQTAPKLEALIALVIGVRKEGWTDERISAGYDKLRNLCRQFVRYESFISIEAGEGAMSPVSLMFRTNSGQEVAYEGFVSAPDDLSETSQQVHRAISEQVANLSKAEKIKVLLAELSTHMSRSDEEDA